MGKDCDEKGGWFYRKGEGGVCGYELVLVELLLVELFLL